jgi:hypothetical protein
VTPRMQLAGWAQMFETIKRRPIQANIQTDGRVFSTENLRDHKQVAVTTRGETMKTTKSPFHVGGKWTWEAHQLCCTKALEETTVAHTVALDHLEALQQRVLKFRTALAPVAEKVGLLSCAGSLDPDALTDVIGDLVTLVEAGGQEFRKQEELIRAILPLFPLHADRRAAA